MTKFNKDSYANINIRNSETSMKGNNEKAWLGKE